MKHRYLLYFALAAVLGACDSNNETSKLPLTGDSLLSMMKTPPPTPPDVPTPLPEIATRYDMEVNNAQELLGELHNGVLLHLRGSDYLISDLNGKGVGGWYLWEKSHDTAALAQKMLVIHDLKDIQLQGSLPRPNIGNRIDGAAVLVLKNCQNVLLDQLNFQNICGRQVSSGGALVLIDCQNIFVRNCTTSGDHAFAVRALRSKDVHLYKNAFTGCHHNAIELQSCENVFIKNTEIKNNAPASAIFHLRDCKNIEIENTNINNNIGGVKTNPQGVALLTENCQKVSWRNSSAAQNVLSALFLNTSGEAPKVEAVLLQDNSFK